MGFQVRKRTKGKSGWLNGSYSSKGVGASGSVKLGKNVTLNTGDVVNGKTPSRLTINFGNGFRYVAYGKRKREGSTASYNSSDWGLIWGIIIAVVVIMAVINNPWWAVGAFFVWLIYKGVREDSARSDPVEPTPTPEPIEPEDPNITFIKSASDNEVEQAINALVAEGHDEQEARAQMKRIRNQ
jgi:hypothetical protein